MKRVILLLVLILLICSGFAFAAVPCKINYQGRLIENNVPVDNTAGIPMIFKLFNTATGTEGEKVVYSGDVPVYNGLFRVVLDLQGIDWTAGEAKYLQVIVDEEPLSPREELSAYPYAINSHLLEGATKEYFLNISGDTQTKQGNLNILGNIKVGKTAYFATEYNNGNSGTAKTIDWGIANKQKLTLTGNVTLTFSPPSGPCNLVLKLVQDATGSRSVTWPAGVNGVKWAAGTTPILTTTANAIDIVSFYYDGTNYYGQASLDFK